MSHRGTPRPPIDLPETIVPTDRLKAMVTGELDSASFSAVEHLDPTARRPAELVAYHCEPELDRRGSSRLAVDRQVLYRDRNRGDDPLSVGRMVDVSRTGLFIATDRSPRPGTVISGTIRIDVDRRRSPQRFLGEVVWSSRWRHPAPRARANCGFGVRLELATRPLMQWIDRLARR